MPSVWSSAPTAPAGADTKTVTVSGTVVFVNGQRPGDPGNCSSVVLVQWADVKGATSARVVYTYQGREASKASAPPYNDSYEFVALYTVPAGYQWVEPSTSWADGPTPNTCQDQVEKVRPRYATEVRVELTIEVDAAACSAAQVKVKAKGKIVKRLQIKVGKAEGQRKRELRRSLKAAKLHEKAAIEKAAGIC